jgi:hypothetical protein
MMRSHAISKKNLSFTTVQVLENASGTRSGTESLPKVFLHDNCEQISFIIFFAFLKKEEMRSGTHFTQQNVFLLFTVVVTKHVWPYFQSRFPKTSSERVSSSYRRDKLLARAINIIVAGPYNTHTKHNNTSPIVLIHDHHGGRRRTTAAIVPHSRLRGVETLANRLCNNAT